MQASRHSKRLHKRLCSIEGSQIDEPIEEVLQTKDVIITDSNG